jgi:uncharacterized protein YyaL (SSP411 family)
MPRLRAGLRGKIRPLKHVKMPNRLAKETSPYLLQHANNLVDWYPWSDEALSRAQAEDKPILLSIGYSACHWCHVMAHESFENTEIARLMNQHFINIKVDREERPDLDSIYMQAVQAITGSGGWPLTVFLTPDRQPFFGGTYFPPQDRHGLPSFPRVLQTVIEAYKNRRNDVKKASKQIMAVLTSPATTAKASKALSADSLKQAHLALERDFDRENGGFGGAPKFPQPLVLEFLLRYSRKGETKNALNMVKTTLEKMARGGIYDQIGGGFHRYATDNRWLVPHFEKMLYDNALLSQVYLHAYLVTSQELFRSVAGATLDYVLREMASPKGGFYSTQDADSEGIEGKYYLWTAEEITELLNKEDGQTVMDYFGASGEGNFEGRNILHVTEQPEPQALGAIGRAKKSLFQKREQRVKPGRDEKILASWNGLMLSSLAEAACALSRRNYLEAAVASASFLLNPMTTEGYLKHSYKDGQSRIDGYLDDYAAVIGGLMSLHQATLGGRWLQEAIRLTDIMLERFWDEATGTLYDASEEQPDLIIRPKSTTDGATPSGASMAVTVLLKLSRLTDNARYEKVALKALQSVRELLPLYPLSFSNWLCALDFYLSEPREIALVGPSDSPATLEILYALSKLWLPNAVIAARDPTDPTPITGLKLLENREMIDNKPTVYVCQRHSCQQPVTDVAALEKQLREV